MVKSPVLGFPRLIASSIVLSLLFSGVAVNQVHAQNDDPNADTDKWVLDGGKVDLRITESLHTAEGGRASYELRLTKQPIDDGWWVRIHVDGIVRYDGVYPEKGISWVPSVGWEFNKENWNEWQGVTIRALEDPDIDYRSVRITHEIWDQNAYCPVKDPRTVMVTVSDDGGNGGGSGGGGTPRSQTVTLDSSNYRVREGETVEVTVRLSLSPANPLTIPLTVNNEDGDTDDDYSGVPENVTFDAGQTEATFTLRAVADDLDEGAERVALEILEGGSETYTVVLESEPAGEVTVMVGGVAGDLTVSPETLRFTPSNWSIRQIVTVSAAEDEDTIVDPPVTLTHTVSGGDYDGVAAADVEVTILENDIPGVKVTPVTVAVNGVTGDLMVSSASLTFTASNWSLAQPMTVMAAEDNDALDDAPVTLTHTVSGGDYAGVTAADVVVTIVENDVPALSIEDAEVTEEDGEIVFAVTMDIPSSRTVRVAWETADGTAKAGEDYQSVVKVSRASRPFLRPPDKARFGSIPGVCDRIATQSAGMQGRSNAVTTFATGCYTRRKGELVFAARNTRQEATVPVLDDSMGEPNETFTVKLSANG